MGFIVVVLFTVVVISWISQSTRQTRRAQRKPKYKQYDEDRYADYFMKKVTEIYNIKIRPEEQSEENDDDENEEETENDIEFEKINDLPPIWLNQQSQYDSVEMEDVEIRLKFLNNISKVFELTGILWLLGITVAETKFPNLKSFLAGETLISLLVKITPVLFLVFAMITRILGSRNKSSSDRILTIIRGIFMVLLGLGYVVNQLSGFLSNSK